MGSKRKKIRFPAWVQVLWGGFNAGAVLGLLDALMIMSFGLASFHKMGQIMGLIFVDAFGMGLIGVGCSGVGFFLVRPILRGSLRGSAVVSGVLLMIVAGWIGMSNLGWSLRTVQGAAPDQGKNILLITLDTLRADSVGFGGNAIVSTPVLDHLARMGWQFSQAVCPVPMTTPSHASILTSTLPAVHGAVENRYRLSPANRTLTEILRESGYRTSAFVSCFPLDRRFGLDQGFMLYQDDFGSPGDLRQASWLRYLLEWRHAGRMERPAHWTNSLVLPWLRKYTGEHPFFLWVHYFDPHAPYMPPVADREYYRNRITTGRVWTDEDDWDRARAAIGPDPDDVKPGRPEERYLGEVTVTDRALGDILRELDRLNKLAGTIIVIVADHGESFGEHGLFYTHGEDIYEPALHVPMILSGPGLPTHRLDNRLTSLLDIAPTVLSALSIPIAPEMTGFDLMNRNDHRETALVENFGIVMAKDARKQRGIRSSGWKYIRMADGSGSELYDLQQDPGESDNIRDTHGELAAGFDQMVESGFGSADQQRIPAAEDVSPETIQKLDALGYRQE